MAHYKISQARAMFSELVTRALSGEEVVILRSNVPVLRLIPFGRMTKLREPGSARGQVFLADDFDQTPEDFAAYV